MPSFFDPVITDAGLAAANAANAAGVQITLSEIAWGAGQYDVRDGLGAALPSAQAMTALTDERERLPLTIGGNPEPDQVEAGAVLAGGGSAFTCYEIGIFLTDGTLFAVAASAAVPFFERGISDTKNTLKLVLANLPAGVINVYLDVDTEVAGLISDRDKIVAILRKTVEDLGKVWDITNPQTIVTALLAWFAAKGHNHNDDYAARGHNHNSDYAAANHNHDTVYAPIEHNHGNTYAALSHGHGMSAISGLATALAALAAKDHGHTVADVANLQSALDAKMSKFTAETVKTANTVLTAASKQLVPTDTAAGTFTVTLPPASTLTDFIIIDDTGSWAYNPLTIKGAGGERIGGLTSRTFDVAGSAIRLVATTTGGVGRWWII